MWQVRYYELVDQMVGHMLRRLHDAEAASAGGVRFTLVVCGDHSTPVLFGDHSHEPVPLAIAHVRHAAEVRASHPIPCCSCRAPPLWLDAARCTREDVRSWADLRAPAAQCKNKQALALCVSFGTAVSHSLCVCRTPTHARVHTHLHTRTACLGGLVGVGRAERFGAHHVGTHRHA